MADNVFGAEHEENVFGEEDEEELVEAVPQLNSILATPASRMEDVGTGRHHNNAAFFFNEKKQPCLWFRPTLTGGRHSHELRPGGGWKVGDCMRKISWNRVLSCAGEVS
jgi:hypothetical protein